MLVKLEADFLDVAGLLVAKEIAGAADVEIVRGELEAGAECVERLQHLEAALGLLRNFPRARQRQQRIGAELGAADPATQLIDLRQSEHIGAMHDQSVRGRNVEAGFDDSGRKEHVIFAIVERAHHAFEHRRRHLAVGDRDAHLRHVLVEERFGVGEILDARTDVKRLSATIALAQQRFAHHDRIERRDEGADRKAIDRRGGDDRHVAYARKCEL